MKVAQLKIMASKRGGSPHLSFVPNVEPLLNGSGPFPESRMGSDRVHTGFLTRSGTGLTRVWSGSGYGLGPDRHGDGGPTSVFTGPDVTP